jgi:PTH1 family peptidyl-tRNA hydrolase
MKILVGLGNPGEKYERNRHNVGFGALDAIAERYGAPAWRKRFQGLATEVDIARQRYLLLKPATYMNESGRSVSEAVRFFKMSPADVIVFHDEIDLEPGKLRVKFGGGHAGHNGLKSISAHIGNDYQRVRIGVGHPGNRDAVAHYVLHDFARADGEWLGPMLAAIAQGLPSLLSGQDAKFMNDVGRAVRPQAAPKAADAPKAAPAASVPIPDAKPAVTAPVADAKPAPVAPSPAAKKKAEPVMAGPERAPAQESGFAKLKAWLRRG